VKLCGNNCAIFKKKVSILKCHEDIIEYMHDYLDEDITPENEEVLRSHLQTCSECRDYFNEMKKAVALVQSTSHISVSEGFTDRVMAQLPKEKKQVGAKRWFKQHPLLTAASLFLLLMTGSIFASFNEDQRFAVTKQHNLIVDGERVIVPAGKTVEGDVVVQNGDIFIKGQVNGNVTVINGEKYMAAAGKVTGQIEEIDQAFEWLWYKIKDFGKSIVSIQSEEKSDE
jgi:anti-sigma factor RsiW